MSNIHVTSEIGNLKKVLLHRPGNELLNLTPDTLARLLFDDIPYLPDAQKEHDAFAKALRDNGVEVVYLEDLMADVMDEIQSAAAEQDIERLRDVIEEMSEYRIPRDLAETWEQLKAAIDKEDFSLITNLLTRHKK